ncbi:MAG: sugar phosphate isomerase/epimerase family protein [Bryobacteraceae bacterium]|nr:sugar phosphate isomerase/epimerase family protein [Bryobacteraceae bacterium]
MWNRREWLVTAGAALASSVSAAPERVKLGVELGSISASKFTPYQYLDYFQAIGIEAAQFNAGTLGIPAGAPIDKNELKKIRDYAASKGVALVSFSGSSISPTTASFDKKSGTAEDHIARGLKIAKILGASAMRVVLGSFRDRPEIATHLASMKQVLKNTRSQIRDSGIRLAIENHNADLTAREIKALIEEVGHDILGVCLDSGNPLVTMEDPHLTLELLGPYALTSHVRDTAVWRVPEGVAARWVTMGQGNVDIDSWVKKFVAMRPGLPVLFESLPMATPAHHAGIHA